MKKILFTVSKILANVTFFVAGILATGTGIALQNEEAINTFFGVKTSMFVNEEGKEVSISYFSSDYKSVSELKKNAKEISQKVSDEGIVLLKNDNALPLKEKAKISLYSVSSADLVYTGEGSSASSSSTVVTLPTALTDEGFLLNEDLLSFYQQAIKEKTYGRGSASGIGASFSIHEAPWDSLPEAKNESADIGLFVLSRNGGEGVDLTLSGGDTTDMEKGNYLLFSKEERDVLSHMKQLKEEGKLSKVVLFINSSNSVNLDDEIDSYVDAIVSAPTLGEVGSVSFSHILSGKVNPSGALSDTIYKHDYLNPVYSNFGSYTYSDTRVSSLKASNSYVVYQEGIYNGYRYPETRYEDVTLNRDNAGSFSYQDTIAYPFGSSLSYTSFSYSDYQVVEEEKDYRISVKVTNSGPREGKHAVELYLQKPYTSYDKEMGIEKSAVELVAFDKTKVLKSQESEDISFIVPKKDLTSYDANGYQTYILEAGDYYFSLADDSHQAINQIIQAKGKDVSASLDLVKKVSISQTDSETYSVSSATGKKITNQFDDVDINRYENKGDNKATYLSRSDWNGTLKLGYDENYQSFNTQVMLSGNSKMADDASYYNYRSLLDDERNDYPTYDSKETDYDLIDLRLNKDGSEIPYDDKKWDALLSQMSIEEQCQLLSTGLRCTVALDSIGKPRTIDHNGAIGPISAYNNNENNNYGLAVKNDDPDKASVPIAYPGSAMVSQTYNCDLIEEYGLLWGEECLWSGYDGLYGPGLNLHRGSYGGRAFEYYSEDPLLTGKIAASLVKGMKKKGIYCYLKHCLLNEQETDREGINTWANEQTIRELYLKPFEIAIEEGKADNVMTSFNRLGTLWSGAHGFVNSVLREEYGMSGFAVSDFYHKEYMNVSVGIYYGNDLPDGSADATRLKNDCEVYSGLAWEVRESCHRILYTVVHSSAMNGIAKGVTIVSLTPVWKVTLIVLSIFFALVFVVSSAFVLYFIVINKKIKK